MHGLLKKITAVFILSASLGSYAQTQINLPVPAFASKPEPLVVAALPQPSGNNSSSDLGSDSDSSGAADILPQPDMGNNLQASSSSDISSVVEANNAAVSRSPSVAPPPLGYASALLTAKPGSNPLPSDLRQNVQQLALKPLPKPGHTTRKPLTLSLNEAILLALRNDPTVITSELQRVIDKFNLIVAHWQYWEPQYSLQGTVAIPTNGATTYGLSTAGVKATTPIGTVLQANYTQSNLFAGPGGGVGGGTAFSVTQPLLNGFGWAYNTTGWYNALDAEETAKLNYKSAVIGQVVSTITNYRGLVQAYASLDIQKTQLAATKLSLDQLGLKLKAGQESKSDYIQQKAQYENQLVQYVNAQQAIETSYYTFLQGLGLDPTADVVIDKKVVVTDFSIPPIKQAIATALQGNIAYQQALIGLRATQRNLITAKSNALWTVNAVYSAGLGNSGASNGGGSNIGLQWTIPINALNLKQAVLNAQVAVETAEVNLANTKRGVINSVISQIITLQSQYQQIKLAQEQVKLQILTVNNTRLKLKFGQSTVFELNTEQQNLINAQNSLLNTEITFENNLTSLYQYLGLTLDRWKIKLRY